MLNVCDADWNIVQKHKAQRDFIMYAEWVDHVTSLYYIMYAEGIHHSQIQCWTLQHIALTKH